MVIQAMEACFYMIPSLNTYKICIDLGFICFAFVASVVWGDVPKMDEKRQRAGIISAIIAWLLIAGCRTLRVICVKLNIITIGAADWEKYMIFWTVVMGIIIGSIALEKKATDDKQGAYRAPSSAEYEETTVSSGLINFIRSIVFKTKTNEIEKEEYSVTSKKWRG